MLKLREKRNHDGGPAVHLNTKRKEKKNSEENIQGRAKKTRKVIRNSKASNPTSIVTQSLHQKVSTLYTTELFEMFC